MPAPSTRPAADPLDDIDRESGGVDTLMERQDRADLPGERSDQPNAGDGDVYLDATREVARESLNPNQEALDAERDVERVVDGDPDIELARESLAPAERGLGADDDDTIDETERAGDDSIR
ncbi:MAG: hypothetical protein M3N82_10685 [Pseudomonadota bacterium]|nr:hypothetical protein [Pseudomonadota bacterium]